jgi:hypothetical protein
MCKCVWPMLQININTILEPSCFTTLLLIVQVQVHSDILLALGVFQFWLPCTHD